MKKRFVTYLLLIIFSLILVMPVNAAGDENWESKITPALWEKLNTQINTRSVGVIPVFVWTEDIDYEEFVEQVFEETGYSADSLAQLYTPIGSEILNYEPGSPEFMEIVEEHKQQTAAAREAENAAVEAYTTAKRRLIREAYADLNSSNVSTLSMQRQSVGFQSQYAPMVQTFMTADQIVQTAASSVVECIDLAETQPTQACSLSSSVQTVQAHILSDTFGYDGAGVKVGQFETFFPLNAGAIQGKYTYLTGSFAPLNHTEYYHAYNVGTIMNYIAPNASYYATSATTNANFYARIEELITAGCSIINMSAGFNAKSPRTVWYSNEEKWLDHIEGPHGISIVLASGNDGEQYGHVTNPAMAYNAITVGAIDDKGTASTADDTFQPYTSTLNNGSDGVAKPDVMAPDTSIPNYCGTSYAAPIVSGVIAQLMEYKPYLKTRSRVVKAVLTASCTYKTEESMNEGITAKEGAGVINAYRAFLIMANNKYASGSFTTEEKVFSIELEKSIGLAWERINPVGNGHTSDVTSVDSYVNLDLYLYNSSGTELAKSSRWHSSAERIWYSGSATYTYTLKIKRTNNLNKTVWYGLAWY